jgi:hypothetical protein
MVAQKKMLVSLILLMIYSGVGMADQLGVPTAGTSENANEAKKYIGKRIKADNNDEEYKNFTSIAFTDYESISLRTGGQEAREPEYLIGMIHEDHPNGSVFLLAEREDESEYVVWMVVRDAIVIPEGLVFGGMPLLDDCFVVDRPNQKIVVIGKPVGRYSKSDRKVRRLIDPVVKAWRVDFSAKKLMEIRTEGIHCELDRDIGAD